MFDLWLACAWTVAVCGCVCIWIDCIFICTPNSFDSHEIYKKHSAYISLTYQSPIHGVLYSVHCTHYARRTYFIDVFYVIRIDTCIFWIQRKCTFFRAFFFRFHFSLVRSLLVTVRSANVHSIGCRRYGVDGAAGSGHWIWCVWDWSLVCIQGGVLCVCVWIWRCEPLQCPRTNRIFFCHPFYSIDCHYFSKWIGIKLHMSILTRIL